MEFEAEEMRVDDNLEVGEEMVDEEEVEVGEDKPKFVLNMEDFLEVLKPENQELDSTVFQCPYITDAIHPDSRHEVTRPESKPFQKLLSIAAKTTFMGDLDRMKHENITSFNVSFNSVCIRYWPKRKFFPKNGFEVRTMLAVLAFNKNRLAEIKRYRRISEVYECFSKSKGEEVTKIKKGPLSDGWKKEIVKESLERKRREGLVESVELVQNELDKYLDVVRDQLEQIFVFSDSEEEDSE